MKNLKYLIIFTLIVPLFAFSSDEEPFPAGRTAATGGSQGGPCDPETGAPLLTSARATSDGTGPLACRAIKVTDGPGGISLLRGSNTNPGTSGAISSPGSSGSGAVEKKQ